MWPFCSSSMFKNWYIDFHVIRIFKRLFPDNFVFNNSFRFKLRFCCGEFCFVTQKPWSWKIISIRVWIWTLWRFKDGVRCKILFSSYFIYNIRFGNCFSISLGIVIRKYWNTRFYFYDDFSIHPYHRIYLWMEKRCFRLGIITRLNLWITR